MNKMRRDPAKNRKAFPSVDMKTNHTKGSIAGNMMGYKASSQPSTSHVKGPGIPGNMMGYDSLKPAQPNPQAIPISDQSKNYGNKPLSEPTRSGFDGKVMPDQMKQYKSINPDSPEWLKNRSFPKKKGAFYG